MEKQTYKYTRAEAGMDKYDDAEMDVTGYFPKAIYTKASRAAYMGNPLIEALPDSLSPLQKNMLYNNPIPDYNRSVIVRKINTKNKSDLMDSIAGLKDLRVILPRVDRLEDYTRTLLMESYHERAQIIDKDTNLALHIRNKERMAHSQLVVDDQVGGPPGGIALLGYAGCGKTNLVRTVMSHYPNVIVHTTPENPMFIQIPILLIECSPFANMSALWEDFGTALDKRLNNIDNFYHDMIARKKTLTDRINIVINLIKQFNIGMIFIDEIEHINFAKSHKDSFEEILTLQNKTNVGIGVIGNEEAYRTMFTDLRQQRRFNKMIHGSSYCHDMNVANALSLKIMEYQWFEPELDFAHHDDLQSFLDVMYKNTKGIVDQIITLWRFVNYDWVINWCDKGRKMRITPKYVDAVAAKYLPEVTRSLLNNLDDIAAGTERTRQNRAAEKAMEEESRRARDELEQKAVLNYYGGDTEEKIRKITDRVISVIRIFHKEMTPEMISKAVRKLYPKYLDTIDEDTYAAKALEYLKKQMEKASGKRARNPGDTADFSAYMSGGV